MGELGSPSTEGIRVISSWHEERKRRETFPVHTLGKNRDHDGMNTGSW